jgi:hypothetical protein
MYVFSTDSSLLTRFIMHPHHSQHFKRVSSGIRTKRGREREREYFFNKLVSRPVSVVTIWWSHSRPKTAMFGRFCVITHPPLQLTATFAIWRRSDYMDSVGGWEIPDAAWWGLWILPSGHGLACVGTDSVQILSVAHASEQGVDGWSIACPGMVFMLPQSGKRWATGWASLPSSLILCTGRQAVEVSEWFNTVGGAAGSAKYN